MTEWRDITETLLDYCDCDGYGCEPCYAAEVIRRMRRFIQDTAIDNGITPADSEDRFWRLSDGTYMPRSVIDLVWSQETNRER